MNHFFTSMCAMGALVLGATGTSLAEPVTFEINSSVTRIESEGATLAGVESIGQEATVRWTWNSNLVDGPLPVNAQTSHVGSVSSFVLEIGGETYEFVNENTTSAGVSTNRLLVLGDDPDVQENYTDRLTVFAFTTFNGSRASASAPLTFQEGGLPILDTQSLLNGNFDPTTIDFEFDLTDSDGKEVTYKLGIELNQIALASTIGDPVAVPTPAAFGAIGLLIPLMAKRRRSYH